MSKPEVVIDFIPQLDEIVFYHQSPKKVHEVYWRGVTNEQGERVSHDDKYRGKIEFVSQRSNYATKTTFLVHLKFIKPKTQ